MTVLKARAKVNLFLNIVGKRQDGLHLIESLSVFTEDIFDEIKITPAKENKFSLKANEFSSFLNGENLVEKALSIFAKNEHYSCELTKNIPVGAGLAGGSSDACAVINYVLKGKKLDEDLLEDLIKLGSDLPLCYEQKPKFVTGIGENLIEVKNLPKFYLLLVNPNKPLLTKDVFKNYSKPFTKNIDVPNFDNNFNAFLEFTQKQDNDLTDSAVKIFPEIQQILDLIKIQDGCRLARMSGSGATCFGIFENLDKARMAKKTIKSNRTGYWVQISK